MNGELSRNYLLLLAAGIDPMTGEFLPEDSVVKRPEVVEALRDGVEALRRMQPAPDERRRKPRQPRAERTWTGDELRRLKQMYIAGASLRMMRKTLGRNTRDLEKQLRVIVQAEEYEGANSDQPWTDAELKRLRELYEHGVPIDGLCKALHRNLRAVLKQMNRIENEPHPENRNGKQWTDWEDRLLKRNFSRGMSLADMAKILCRTEYAVQLHMEKLGLIPGSGHWTQEEMGRLRQLANGKNSASEIAVILGRSEQEVKNRLAYMGLGGKSLNLLGKRNEE